MDERLPKDLKPTFVATVGSAQGSLWPEWSQQPQPASEELLLDCPNIAVAVRNAAQARLNAIQPEVEG